MSQDIKKMMHDMQDRIREVAYLMWELAGRQHGMATEYWHAAEREVRAAFEAAAAKIKPSAESKPDAKKPAPPKPEAQKPAPKPATAAPAKPAPEPVSKPIPNLAPTPPARPAPEPASKPAPKPAATAPGKPASAPASKPAPKPAAPSARTASAPTSNPAPKPAPASAAPAVKMPAKATPASKPVSIPAAPTAKAPAKAATSTNGYKTVEIEGIGPAYARKLAAVGIETSDHLLDQCGSAKGRAAVSDKTGITAKLLLKWANMADLMRISGVAGENAELLEAAGVDTIKELKTRKADNLAAKMAEINEKKKLIRRVASAKQVEKWVEQAKALEPRITH